MWCCSTPWRDDSGKASRRLYNQAIALTPDSFILRRKFMSVLGSNGKDSQKLMIAFFNEKQNQGLPAAQSGILQAMIYADQGDMDDGDEKDDHAISNYAKAVAAMGDNTALMEHNDGLNLIRRLGRAYENAGQYEHAVATFSSAIDLAGKDCKCSAELYAARGYNLVQLGRAESAIPDYQLAAQYGNAWAQNALGSYYYFGRYVPQDKKLAIDLFRRSAAQGNAEAKKNLAANKG